MSKYKNGITIMKIDSFTAITKALSDNHRVRALVALRNGELCVCQLIEMLALAPSTVSKHMSILKQAGLVESRKEGRWIYYRLPDKDDLNTTKWLLNAVIHSQEILEDDKHLKKITCADLEIMCKKQRNGKC
jgi:ArsR family transcriptional regulator, arsenate/arsenite/antimonite-responsive transcriptional repressor